MIPLIFGQQFTMHKI